jgi:hypothetical protein
VGRDELPDDVPNPDQHTDTAVALSEQFLEVARRSKSEEDVKIGIEMALRPALEILEIDSTGRYDVTLLDGAADAIYGHVVIEYEKPGKIRTKSGYDETTGQLRQYLYSFAQEQASPEEALKRMVGVSIDGTSIVFCQYRTATADIGRLPGTQISLLPTQELVEGFEIRGPYDVTPESVALMLSCLRAMARPPLTAAALTREFGPEGDIARTVVPNLHSALDKPSEHVQMFFKEWTRLFGIVYGEDLRHTEKRARELGALYGIEAETPDLLGLLFAIHTYFALLMKLIAVELVALQRGALIEPFVRRLPGLPDKTFRDELSRLESGDLFSEYGIANFVEGDFFQWYLSSFDGKLAAGVRSLVQKLDEFEPTATTMEPEKAEDLLKELYQALIPRSLRHDLGEFYTPDWLATYLIDRAGYDGTPGKRVLDPSCGSGTFLVQLIRMLRRRCLEEQRDLRESAELILESITGFDINPLAVIAARTNYLLALGDLVRHVTPLDVPVYFADSVLTPAKLAGVLTPASLQAEELGEVYRYRTVVGEFPIPREVVEGGRMEGCATLIEQTLRSGYDAGAFAERAMTELGLTAPETAAGLKALFGKISELEAANLDGIWARILRNSVAPLAVGRYDFVIGNPPWIQWEDLAPDYRAATENLWLSYGLTPSAGSEQYELGKSKRDMSMLFSYVCTESYLKPGGVLAFLITQTVFQTATGEVFRRFRLPSGRGVQVMSADDFVEIKPFDAQNWSAAVVWKEGERTEYPVTYRLWRRLPGVRVRRSDSQERVELNTERIELAAEPLDTRRRESPWLLARRGAHGSLRHFQGTSPYRGSAGLVTWADGVYWLDVQGARGDGRVIVENLHDAGKLKLDRVRMAIEPDLLLPFVRWASIERWSATATHSLLLPHTAETGYRAIPEEEMRRRFPATLEYLYRFKQVLERRSGYRQLRQGQPFYICGNTGTDFRAPYKVVWRSMGTEVRAAILRHKDWWGHTAPEVHKNTVSFVPLQHEEEALYLCGMLNSSYITTYALGSSVRGGKSFAGTGLLNSIAVPQYDASDYAHQRVIDIAAGAIANPLEEDRDELDETTAFVWGIDERTLDSLRETRDVFVKPELPEIALPSGDAQFDLT